ncbi:hypothetical protein CRENBAI_006957 [Crenichthys baileyi]|uniref:Uncharacterized protein n=1 Tax=Crenichthys baileyi TaxID=28760 RepID=A0AAV9R118_9TELE
MAELGATTKPTLPRRLSPQATRGGGGPTGGWPRVSLSGLARLGPAWSNPAPGALRRVPTPSLAPGWYPGSAVLGDITCLNRVVLIKAKNKRKEYIK